MKDHLPPGPWQDEPDRVEFRHAGLPCLMNRNRMGVWCGYVAVPPGHPLHGKHYGDVEVDVHGGRLTYSDVCQGEICHVPAPGQPDDVFWFGFDCAHAMDLVPGIDKVLADIGHPRPSFMMGDVYRDMAYVRREVESLAEQLARAPQTTVAHPNAPEGRT
jgi:hypothetical protein